MEHTYKLIANQYGKNKTIYRVIDETGKEISHRVSAREYVACTINGEYYFGRLDLIGKGEHGQMLSRIEDYKVNTLEKYEKIIRDRIREIRLCNKMHLDTYRRYSTPERLNAPIEEWEYNHLVEFYGKEVADSVHTKWDYQVATTNDDRDIENFLKAIGDFETWKKQREEWVRDYADGFRVAYLGK